MLYLCSWVRGVLRLGYERPLQETDIYDAPPDDSSVKLCNNLGRCPLVALCVSQLNITQYIWCHKRTKAWLSRVVTRPCLVCTDFREWEKELYSWRTGGRASLLHALARCYWLWLLAVGLVLMLVVSWIKLLWLWSSAKTLLNIDSDLERGTNIYFWLEQEGLRVAQALFLGWTVLYFESESRVTRLGAYSYAGVLDHLLCTGGATGQCGISQELILWLEDSSGLQLTYLQEGRGS